ncbi:indole-3-glycerol phosphate synthase TrpC [Streptomyces sp. RM72]|uniref:indole-3-glycerol phosphate synthase TrpC n=1 Tax=Streptomyces sp. RM72 TaxID=1115510 RepID=UPI001B368269|nr:indole-3-glycerol phosphate synthase TrpC [Streptomyces sp. RM72]MBQ0890458.1 indole-3-glycerol phosphate synthase TrpC [Streptomyces sp. RM72]
MSDLLTRITAYKRDEIAAARKVRPESLLRDRAAAAAPPRGFLAAIERRQRQGEYALIAEVKKRSPSKGLIRADFDPAELARAYEAGGATCLSVLTDSPSFDGSLDHVTAVLAAVGLPVLRKDFMLDPYQVVEARAWGADAILLMLSTVDDDTAAAVEDTAREFGMDVLIEVHDSTELERAARLRSTLIGINNRDLKTMVTSLSTAERLAPQVPEGKVVVAESGLRSPMDLKRMAAVGVTAFLVGESLAGVPDVEPATRALLAQ